MIHSLVAMQLAMFLFHFITRTDVSFHFISIFYCHLCRCKSYFVWHEWDIFCLIKFKLWLYFVVFASIQFGIHTVTAVPVCVCRCWCNFVVEMVSLSLFLLLLFLVLLQVSIALVDLRLENMLLQAHTVRVMAMPQKHRTVVNYAGKVMNMRNILPSRFITHCHGFVLTQLQFPLLLNTFSIERMKTIEQNERR